MEQNVENATMKSEFSEFPRDPHAPQLLQVLHVNILISSRSKFRIPHLEEKKKDLNFTKRIEILSTFCFALKRVIFLTYFEHFPCHSVILPDLS